MHIYTYIVMIYSVYEHNQMVMSNVVAGRVPGLISNTNSLKMAFIEMLLNKYMKLS